MADFRTESSCLRYALLDIMPVGCFAVCASHSSASVPCTQLVQVCGLQLISCDIKILTSIHVKGIES